MDWAERINQAMVYIEENLYDIDYDAISRIVLCPMKMFQRFFTLATGITLTEYIRNRRLSEAARAIQDTDAKIIDIALQCGYETPDAFGVAFKRLYGVAQTEQQ